MKKSALLFIPLLVVLASCTQISFLDYEHSAGLEKSMSNNPYSAISYNYFSGDNLETEGLSVARFTFNVSKTDSNMSKDAVAEIIACDNAQVTYTVEDAQYVGSKEEIGTFIGLDSEYVNGALTLQLDKEIKCVTVKASRYYHESSGFEENVFIDADVAIAVNNSRYIKLSGTKDDAGIPQATDCSYNLSANTNTVTIKVGPQRAFIKEIICYF